MLKELIKLQYVEPFWIHKLAKIKGDKQKRIFLIGTPAHGNLGDHAIAIEEMNYLRNQFPMYDIYEILMPMYLSQKKRLLRYIRQDDIIIISGGGWMGNLWIHNENVIREIVSSYPNNQIVIFPQTLYYTDDCEGEKELETTKEIFMRHRNLTLFVRESASYDIVTSRFKFLGSSNVYLVPDMVLFGSFGSSSKKRDGKKILVCFRDDCEKTIEGNNHLSLPSEYKVSEISTIKGRWIPLRKREMKLRENWDQFSTAGVVITDRLHAMLFSVLNGTPCIALNNKTGKVFGVAKWLEKNNMIIPVLKGSDILLALEKTQEIKPSCYNRDLLLNYFDDMANIVRKGIVNNGN